MNIIPEEPEQYVERNSPAPALSGLLTSKQFNYYTNANATQLFSCIRLTYSPHIVKHVDDNTKILASSHKPANIINRRSLFYLGIGFGVLALTKAAKALAKSG